MRLVIGRSRYLAFSVETGFAAHRNRPRSPVRFGLCNQRLNRLLEIGRVLEDAEAEDPVEARVGKRQLVDAGLEEVKAVGRYGAIFGEIGLHRRRIIDGP